MTISRRDAIKKAALAMGGAFLLPDILKAWDLSTPPSTDFHLTTTQDDTLAEMCETIIPATSTPGAKAAEVPEFVKRMIADCHTKEDQDIVSKGLSALDQEAKSKHGKSFSQITNEQRIAILKVLEASQSRFWKTMKDLTVTGYFTSEIGMTQTLRYEPVPGSYDGAYPYKKGDKAWAK